MKTIQLLPQNLIAQIAAGEVIERPAYVIKELLDNAIDANATSIIIDVIDSGLTKIVVTDNGTGMGKEDLLESYKLHTTSKIHNHEFLLAMKTLGFRGEALASIAAVSGLTIESKLHTETIGTKIYLHYGEMMTTESIGMPSGTRIIVENLFSNVPVRKKFLKSKRTEMRHILDIVSQYSLAMPQIHLQLSHEGKTLLELPSFNDMHQHIQIIFKDIPSSSLLPLMFSDNYFHIEGMIGTPQLSSMISPKQYISVNNRPISDRLISLAIKQAYGILLPEGTQPTFFLNISLPFELVDVNVHPRKEQINFIDERLLFDSITKAIQQSLTTHNLTFHSPNWQPTTKNVYSITQTELGKKLKEEVLPWNTKLLGKIVDKQKLIQVHNLYIITPSAHGFIVVDQHAAHERILYEKFMIQFTMEKKNQNSKTLIPPVLLELTLSESEILYEQKEYIEQVGFFLEPFHGSTWRVTHAPSLLIDRDIQTLLKELIGNKKTESYPTIDTESKKMLAFLACKSAVKSGDPLTPDQMQDILLELEKIPEAITCPHGRPVKWEISLHELNKLFKRS